MTSDRLKKFRAKVWRYYRQNKRDLPWRKTRDPYHILVSEIMLQQTQVDRVIPKYQQFMAGFPTLETLAAAPLSAVLIRWQGLGYNRRARYLKLAAEHAVKNYHGQLPSSEEELKTFPGIGPYTAAAVAAFAFNQPTMMIETNIRTVFLHEFFPRKTNVPDAKLLPLIAAACSPHRAGEWYQALMDYGTMLKQHHPNPSRRSAAHMKQSTFTGINRQLRGQIIRELTKQSALTFPQLKQLTKDDKRLAKTLGQLEQEGFILHKRNKIRLAT